MESGGDDDFVVLSIFENIGSIRFAWCSPMKRLPTRIILLIPVMGFATLTILKIDLQWINLCVIVRQWLGSRSYL